MALCEQCNEEMTTATTCLFPIVLIDGKQYQRNTEYHDVNDRCHDCGIVNGNVHHFGCDIERCPKCDGQLISCDCHVEGVVMEGSKQ